MSKSLADNPFITEAKDKNGDSWYHQIVLELKDKEIERLNNLLKETSQTLSEQTTKAITLKSENKRLNNIINEFDKWLLGEQMMFYKGNDGETLIRYGETTNKWLELKGSDKE